MSEKAAQNYINHIALVLDGSSSMSRNAHELIKVADEQIAYLAQRSKDLDQETRVSVYIFADDVRCVIYDKDVLRLPSIKQHYRAQGMTALIDATNLSLDDLAMTPEKYGDHAFLVYVLTDGQENASVGGNWGHRYVTHEARGKLASDLARRLHTLPDHWTVAVLVPDQRGKFEAKNFGFPADNIAIWDANSAQGVNEAGSVIRQATDRFMEGRQQGIRGSRSVFSTGADAVNAVTIQQAALKPLAHNAYKLVPVPDKTQIRPFVEACGYTYRVGDAYYQLTKRETIQARKELIIVERTTDQVYVGSQVRDMLGLPAMETRVSPEFNPKYDIYVQSTSVNRNLLPGTKLLILTGR